MEPTTLKQILKDRIFDLQYLIKYKFHVVRIYMNVRARYLARAKRGKILPCMFGLIWRAVSLVISIERNFTIREDEEGAY